MNKRGWVVVLTKKLPVAYFRSDFFPRQVAYKKDAEEYVREVKAKGGDAKIVSAREYQT
jgi:hypothetical protein